MIASPRAEEQSTLWEIDWRWLTGREAIEEERLLERFSELYSAHYGRWGSLAPHPGERVRMSVEKLRRMLDSECAWVAYAERDGELIGYCTAVQLEIEPLGRIAWVTQLVVHSSYRQQRVATTLLYSIWQFSDCFAWGLATPNPFAVRALETATRRQCRAALIRENETQILPKLSELVEWLPAELVRDGQSVAQPRVDTEFFVDHGAIERLLRAASRPDRRWALGRLDDGEEWFACTFASQEPEALTRERLADLLIGSDGIWIRAYEGMALDGDHTWHRHAESEVAWILEQTGLTSSARVLDVGCGDGRHASAFAERGCDVDAVDISPELVARARERDPNVRFHAMDARNRLPAGEYDLVVCLYDVIGSSARSEDDRELIRNLANGLKPGGYLVASVMNAEVVLPQLPSERRPENLPDFVRALEKLPPSTTMEQSGAVFDPELILYYDGVHYRKEQFQRTGWRLPTELVVRDRRFSTGELTSLIDRAGLTVASLTPVQSGGWNRSPPLAATNQRAKELLVVATKLQEAEHEHE